MKVSLDIVDRLVSVRLSDKVDGNDWTVGGGLRCTCANRMTSESSVDMVGSRRRFSLPSVKNSSFRNAGIDT